MAKPTAKRLANREYNQTRRLREPWQAWYSLARWKAIRAQQLATQPLCERCLAAGSVTPAEICHHVIPHRGRAEIFWNGPLASACRPCHDRDDQAIEKGGRARQVVGIDGWPIG